MKTVTVADVRKWNPCYDPAIYKGEGWVGTALDILAIPEIPNKDKLWFVLREDLISKATLQEFATWCASQVQFLIKDPKWLTISDMGMIKDTMPEETPERLAISAIHYASHGMAFEAAKYSAAATGDTVRDSQINKLLELIKNKEL